MTFEYLVEHLLVIPDQSALKDVYMLTPEGKILLQASKKRRQYKVGTLVNDMADLPLFCNPLVVEAVRNKQSGYREDTQAGQTTLTAYYKLNRIGWYFVVEADSQILFGKAQGG